MSNDNYLIGSPTSSYALTESVTLRNFVYSKSGYLVNFKTTSDDTYLHACYVGVMRSGDAAYVYCLNCKQGYYLRNGYCYTESECLDNL